MHLAEASLLVDRGSGSTVVLESFVANLQSTAALEPSLYQGQSRFPDLLLLGFGNTIPVTPAVETVGRESGPFGSRLWYHCNDLASLLVGLFGKGRRCSPAHGTASLGEYHDQGCDRSRNRCVGLNVCVCGAVFFSPSSHSILTHFRHFFFGNCRSTVLHLLLLCNHQFSAFNEQF